MTSSEHTLPNGLVVVFRSEARAPGEGDPVYALEKLTIAVHTLATHRSELRARLSHAARELIMVSPSDFPIDLRPLYQALKGDMTKLAPNKPGQSRIDATVARARLATCENIARRIYDLTERLRDHPSVSDLRNERRPNMECR